VQSVSVVYKLHCAKHMQCDALANNYTVDVKCVQIMIASV